MADDAVLGTLTAKLNLDTSAAQAAVGKLAGMFGPLSGAVAALGGAVIAVGALAIDLGSKYQSSLAMIEGRMGITAAAGNAIGAAFLSTAGKATFSAVTIAQAFAPVAGQLDTINDGALSAGDSLAFMESAMALASATGEPLAEVTATLAGILQTFALNLNQAGDASTVLFNTSNALGVPIDSLATSLDRARTNAGAASPSLSDLSTLLLDLAEHGETGRGALTLLGTALTGIETPTAKVLDAQKKLNLSFLEANGQLKPLSSIIGELHPIIDKMGNAQATATLKSLGFGSASGKLVGIIDAGLPTWDTANDKVKKAGTVAKTAGDNTNTLAGAWSKFSSNVSDMLTTAGTPLNTFLKNVVNWMDNHLQPAVQWMINNWPIWSKILIPIVAAWGTWEAVAATGKIVGMLQGVGVAMGIIGGTGLEAGVAASLEPILALGALSFAGLIELLNLINPIGTYKHLPGVNPTTGAYTGVGANNYGKTQLTAPGGASGGLANAGMPRLIGEYGPELFRPNVSGTIIPNHMLGGGGTVINQYIYGTTQGAAAEIQSVVRSENSRLIRMLAAGRR